MANIPAPDALVAVITASWTIERHLQMSALTAHVGVITESRIVVRGVALRFLLLSYSAGGIPSLNLYEKTHATENIARQHVFQLRNG